jgi:protease I
MNHQWLRQMFFLGLVMLLLIGCSGAQVEPTATPTRILPTPTPLTRPGARRALFVIYARFHETEYGVPRAVLEERGIAVAVAAPSPDVVKGHEGAEVQPDVLLGDVRVGDYDAVVFVGGYGYEVDDPEGQRLAREAVAESKVVAAICIAPITLAKADVVEGKRVTASMQWNVLEEAGAIVVTDTSVVRDGLIITANGPGGARKFGEAIAAALGE